MSFFVPTKRETKAFDEPFWADFMSGVRSATGKTVNYQTAIRVAAVFACCRVIGNGEAQVPLKVMRRDGRTRLPAIEHPLYELLSLKPNAWQTSFEFRQQISWIRELFGNAFVYISRGFGGKILELIPFPPGHVTVKRNPDWTLEYTVTGLDGTTKEIPASSIWHLRGPTLDGFQGLDVIALAREAVGLALATEEAVSRLHANGIRNSGVYSFEGKLTDTQFESLNKWVNNQFGGMVNAGKAMILDRGAKFHNNSMTSIDAQTIETRGFQIEQICSFFGVLPIKIGYSNKTVAFTSVEEMNRAHREDCLAPRWEAWEQSAMVNLLTPEERKAGYYINFTEEGMLRGSAKEVSEMLLAYVNGGVLTPNQALDLLDMNPDNDPRSDQLRIPANIVGATDGQN